MLEKKDTKKAGQNILGILGSLEIQKIFPRYFIFILS